VIQVRPSQEELMTLVREYFVAERTTRTYQSTWNVSNREHYDALYRYNRIRCAMLMLVFGDNDRKARELWTRTPPWQGFYDWQYVLDTITNQQQTTGEQQ